MAAPWSAKDRSIVHSDRDESTCMWTLHRTALCRHLHAALTWNTLVAGWMARDPGRLCLVLGCLKGRPIRLASCRVVLMGVSSLTWKAEVSETKPAPAWTSKPLLKLFCDAAGLQHSARPVACAMTAPEQHSRRACSRHSACHRLCISTSSCSNKGSTTLHNPKKYPSPLHLVQLL